MSAVILVVDDNVELARSAAALITNRTALKCAFASNAALAQDLVEQNRIAVAVLDQRMPEIPGTELYLRLKEVRPNLRAIMLTGEADTDEVGHALKIGFVDYLHKSRISNLPESVSRQYLHFLTADLDSLMSSTVRVVWPTSWLERRFRRREIRLLSLSVLDPEVIDVQDWKTVVQLNAGEQKRVANESTGSYSLSMENESQKALKAAMKLSPRTVKSATENILEYSKYNITRHRKAVNRSIVRTVERTYSLPEASDNSHSAVSVRSRNFQQAKVRKKLLATYQVRCKCCDLSCVVPAVLYQDTGLVATRHQDILSDGSSVLVDTGLIFLTEFDGKAESLGYPKIPSSTDST